MAAEIGSWVRRSPRSAVSRAWGAGRGERGGEARVARAAEAAAAQCAGHAGGRDYCYYAGLPETYVTVLGMIHTFLHYTLVYSKLATLVSLALSGTLAFPAAGIASTAAEILQLRRELVQLTSELSALRKAKSG